MKNILVSACLLGVPCRYDGKSKPHSGVMALGEKYNLIPVCPEVLGGLKIPHPPSEILDGKVIDKNGKDVTDCLTKVLETAIKNNCKAAVLKSKSPSCGTKCVYDGTFSDTLIPGMGITAKLLSDNNIFVTDENELSL